VRAAVEDVAGNGAQVAPQKKLPRLVAEPSQKEFGIRLLKRWHTDGLMWTRCGYGWKGSGFP